jgi:hypothetical protein
VVPALRDAATWDATERRSDEAGRAADATERHSDVAGRAEDAVGDANNANERATSVLADGRLTDAADAAYKSGTARPIYAAVVSAAGRTARESATGGAVDHST